MAPSERHFWKHLADWWNSAHACSSLIVELNACRICCTLMQSAASSENSVPPAAPEQSLRIIAPNPRTYPSSFSQNPTSSLLTALHSERSIVTPIYLHYTDNFGILIEKFKNACLLIIINSVLLSFPPETSLSRFRSQRVGGFVFWVSSVRSRERVRGREAWGRGASVSAARP